MVCRGVGVRVPKLPVPHRLDGDEQTASGMKHGFSGLDGMNPCSTSGCAGPAGQSDEGQSAGCDEESGQRQHPQKQPANTTFSIE